MGVTREDKEEGVGSRDCALLEWAGGSVPCTAIALIRHAVAMFFGACYGLYLPIVLMTKKICHNIFGWREY